MPAIKVSGPSEQLLLDAFHLVNELGRAAQRNGARAVRGESVFVKTVPQLRSAYAEHLYVSLYQESRGAEVTEKFLRRSEKLLEGIKWSPIGGPTAILHLEMLSPTDLSALLELDATRTRLNHACLERWNAARAANDRRAAIAWLTAVVEADAQVASLNITSESRVRALTARLLQRFEAISNDDPPEKLRGQSAASD